MTNNLTDLKEALQPYDGELRLLDQNNTCSTISRGNLNATPSNQPLKDNYTKIIDKLVNIINKNNTDLIDQSEPLLYKSIWDQLTNQKQKQQINHKQYVKATPISLVKENAMIPYLDEGSEHYNADFRSFPSSPLSNASFFSNNSAFYIKTYDNDSARQI